LRGAKEGSFGYAACYALAAHAGRGAEWIINILIPCLIIASYVAYRESDYQLEKRFAGILVAIMAITALYGMLKLRQMQATYDAHCPPKDAK